MRLRPLQRSFSADSALGCGLMYFQFVRRFTAGVPAHLVIASQEFTVPFHCGIVTKPGHSAGRPGGVLVVCRATRAQAYLNEYSEKLSAESRKNRMIKQCSLVRQTWHSEQAGQMFALSTFCKKGIALSFAHVVPVSIRCTVSVWPWQWSTKRTGSRWSVVRLVSDHCSVDSVECLGCWTVCAVSTPGQ